MWNSYYHWFFAKSYKHPLKAGIYSIFIILAKQCPLSCQMHAIRSKPSQISIQVLQLLYWKYSDWDIHQLTGSYPYSKLVLNYFPRVFVFQHSELYDKTVDMHFLFYFFFQSSFISLPLFSPRYFKKCTKTGIIFVIPGCMGFATYI